VATDNHGKQPIRTLADGDASVGILDTGNLRIDPAKEGGNLLSIKSNTDNLDVALSTVATQTTLATLNGKFTSDTDDDSIAGSQTSALALSLGHGWDGSAWERLTTDGSGSLDVNITGGASSGPTDTDDDSIAGGQSVGLSTGLNYGWDGSVWERLQTDGSGALDCNVTASALPSGASTSALQTSGNTSLTTIAGDTTSLDGKFATEADDGSVAAASTHQSVVNLNYGYNGTTWERIETDNSTNSLLVSWDATSTFAVEMLDQGTTLDSILAQLGGTGGTAVSDYSSDDIAGGNPGPTTNHDYDVGGAAKLQSVVCSSTAAAKYEIQISSSSKTVHTTYWVALTSESSPSVTIDCSDYAVPAGERVRIIKDNLESAVTAITLYTTINTNE